MRLIYNFAIHTLGAAFSAAALFNDKARLWRDGRRGIFRRMEEALAANPPLSAVAEAHGNSGTRGDSSVGRVDGQSLNQLVWFHCASLGEFEQGRPVIEAFREQYPQWKILVTFFSPSGYEIRKNYPGADYIFYLPIDTVANVRRFLSLFRPQIAVFVKYEFWANYLLELQRSGARSYLISGIFRPDQSFFRWYGDFFRRVLRSFERLFVQNNASLELLQGIGVNRVEVAGDTRFDRVYAIAQQAKQLPWVERFAAGTEVFVAGSTWPPDEELLVELINAHPAQKFILAPHEIDSARIERLIARINRPALRYTQLSDQSDLEGASVLFIDTIGILSSVYRYGRWGYIGGGFGVGIHNTLEAATFGLPLAFGPNYAKFQEACELIAQGAARSISSYEELAAWFEALSTDPAARAAAGLAAARYVADHKGATQQILCAIGSH